MENTIIRAAGGLLWNGNITNRLLAVVHRKKYDDWTLPKGKLKDGESWIDAAIREVQEETACMVVLGSFAGCISYTVNNVPKIVKFWNMEDRGLPYNLHDEGEGIDEIAWITIKNAIRILKSPLQRAFLEGLFLDN